MPDDLSNFDRLNGRGDDLYAALMAAHDGLSSGASVAFNARLILLLINAIGDPDTVLNAISQASTSQPPEKDIG